MLKLLFSLWAKFDKMVAVTEVTLDFFARGLGLVARTTLLPLVAMATVSVRSLQWTAVLSPMALAFKMTISAR